MSIRLALLLWALLVIAGPAANAQQTAAPPQTSQAQTDSAKPIQDNSFLIEEAYNQEDGVVQHINSFTRLRDGQWAYTFTQEWPVTGIKHQLSYTIPIARAASEVGKTTGIGDIALNYRYQLIGDGDAGVAVAPRLSLLVPTGDEKKGLGAGGLGIQFNIPVSVVLSPLFVTHLNAGMTFTPAAKNASGAKGNLQDYNLGQSLIWLASPNFNVMFEALWQNQEEVVGPKRTERHNEFQINPGIRWAYNFKSGLQIVPGVSLPVGLGPSEGQWGVMVYLSFEHSFKKGHK